MVARRAQSLSALIGDLNKLEGVERTAEGEVCRLPVFRSAYTLTYELQQRRAESRRPSASSIGARVGVERRPSVVLTGINEAEHPRVTLHGTATLWGWEMFHNSVASACHGLFVDVLQ